MAIRGTPAHLLLTSKAAGDMRPGAGEVNWSRVAPLPWQWVRQVHSGGVVALAPGKRPGDLAEGPSADGMVASGESLRLAMFAADCALVAMASPEGITGLAHCGWRGLVAGIIEAVADEMRLLGASSIRAVRGPCIGPECYEFGLPDLALVEARYGPAVRSRTASGALSLDLPSGVRLAAASAGIAAFDEVGSCTACDPRWFSWRARREEGRHAMVVVGPSP